MQRHCRAATYQCAPLPYAPVMPQPLALIHPSLQPMSATHLEVRPQLLLSQCESCTVRFVSPRLRRSPSRSRAAVLAPRGAADLPPCVESGAAAVDTTGWRPGPGYGSGLAA